MQLHVTCRKDKEKSIRNLFDGFPISDEFGKLLALTSKHGRMRITDLTEKANDEYKNSRELKSQLTSSTKQHDSS